jgi:hypothetical protein
MWNHFHLVVETPQANLVAGMKWFLGTYTARFNRRHRQFGHLFSGRYKSLIVDGSGNGYLKTVCDYVHLNPARAKLIAPEEKLSAFGWSSYPLYLQAPGRRPAWLGVQRLLGEHGIPRDSAAGRKQFSARMEARRAAEDGSGHKQIRRGWCLGDEAFRQELLAQVDTKAGPNHYGAELGESAQAKAERIVAEAMQKLRWDETELAGRRKGDPAKVKMAQRLRVETTMTLAWIAQRLRMGTKTHLAHLLYRQKLKQGKS